MIFLSLLLQLLVLVQFPGIENSFFKKYDTLNTLNVDTIPLKNQLILNYTVKHGPKISPTYEKAVCTELLIGILKNFITLSDLDKKKIRIISDENIAVLRLKNSPVPKGVYYALTSNNMGAPIDDVAKVLPGDLVQFWNLYWGHCGVVKAINVQEKTMELYSSFPSTGGYGIQTFAIPEECYFVRLK